MGDERLREAACPICGKRPIDLACVRDWLLAAGMPLHSEWQERMIQYANEVGRAALSAQKEYIGSDGRSHFRVTSGNCHCGWTIINEFEWEQHLKNVSTEGEPQAVKHTGLEVNYRDGVVEYYECTEPSCGCHTRKMEKQFMEQARGQAKCKEPQMFPDSKHTSTGPQGGGSSGHD